MSSNETELVAAAPVSATVIVRELPWWRLLLVRVARTYVQNLSGMSAIFLVIPAELALPAPIQVSFVLGPIIAKFVVALQWALVPALFALLYNLAELLTKFDQTHPEWRA